MKKLLTILLAVVALTACVNDGTYDGEVEMAFSDIMTFEGNDDGQIRFSFQKAEDSPLIEIFGKGTIDEKECPVGTRVIVSYVPESGKAYTPGPVTFRNILRVNQGKAVVENIEDYPEWNRDKVFLYSIWRTGSYLNLNGRIIHSDTPRHLRLVVNEKTIDNAYPDAFLVHQLPEPEDNYSRTFYASFSIDSIWNLPTCQGLRVHVANSNLDQNVFEFTFNK